MDANTAANVGGVEPGKLTKPWLTMTAGVIVYKSV